MIPILDGKLLNKKSNQTNFIMLLRSNHRINRWQCIIPPGNSENSCIFVQWHYIQLLFAQSTSY